MNKYVPYAVGGISLVGVAWWYANRHAPEPVTVSEPSIPFIEEPSAPVNVDDPRWLLQGKGITLSTAEHVTPHAGQQGGGHTGKSIKAYQLRIGTCNVAKELSDANVTRTVRVASSHCDYFGTQETNRLAASQAGSPGFKWLHGDCEDATAHRPDIVSVSSLEKVLLHHGMEKTSPDRYAVVDKIKPAHDDTFPGIIAINTHLVSGAWNSKEKTNKAWRQDMWRQSYKILSDMVAAYHEQGHPVIFLGDYNRLVMQPFRGGRWLTVPGIDKIGLLPHPNGPKVRLLSTMAYPTPSDHPLKTIRVRITR